MIGLAFIAGEMLISTCLAGKCKFAPDWVEAQLLSVGVVVVVAAAAVVVSMWIFVGVFFVLFMCFISSGDLVDTQTL